VRAFDIALTALALRASTTQSPKPERRTAPAIGKPDAAALNRNALNRQRAALIASLWPEARPCIVPALYMQLPAPAEFGALFRVSWQHPCGDACPLPLAESAPRIVRAA
jgi:hypothetical protein